MNHRPFAHPRSLPLLSRSRRGLRYLLACLLLLVLAACGDDEEPTPTPASAPAAEAPVSALPTAAPTQEAAVAPTETPAASTPEGIAALIATPDATNAVITPTATADNSTPLEAEEADCEVESSLDLVGYPNLEQQMGCATEAAIVDPIAINEFGAAQPADRYMLWFSHEGMIYVLLPDSTYQTFEDTWDEATDPTFPCNPPGGEEDSPPLPRRGFGKLWCEHPEFQEVLGLVPREERLCQYSVLQRFQTGRLLACFEDGTIRYFRILDDGTWDLQMQ